MVFPSRLSVPKSLMVRGYEPGSEDHEFDPRIGDFFLSIERYVATVPKDSTVEKLTLLR